MLPETYNAALVLENGSFFLGRAFGARAVAGGEVVFNTGMVGYVESVTDPSYAGQILCQTSPLIGNYGVDPTSFESDGPKIEGYVVHELCDKPSHWTSRLGVDEWLKAAGVPGIAGVDTRQLTRLLRAHGTMLGLIASGLEITESYLTELRSKARSVADPNKTDLVSKVTVGGVMTCKPASTRKARIVLMDCGVKESIVRSLLVRGAEVVRVPASADANTVLGLEPDGVVISNGPGDPKVMAGLIRTLATLAETRIPIFGICLGNQLLALALGGDTYKLKFGHRGQNHPCVDTKTGRCYITSQNHGFAVSEKLDGTGLEVAFVNANDKSVEGVAHKTLPVFGVQFHPEAAPGPEDTAFLFDKFMKTVKEAKDAKV